MSAETLGADRGGVYIHIMRSPFGAAIITPLSAPLRLFKEKRDLEYRGRGPGHEQIVEPSADLRAAGGSRSMYVIFQANDAVALLIYPESDVLALDRRPLKTIAAADY